MHQDWNINLAELTAAHESGLTIKRVSGGYGKGAFWEVVSGNASDSLVNDGISWFEHAVAKEVLEYYLSQLNVSLDVIATIATRFEAERNIRQDVSKEKLAAYLEDKMPFPIGEISTIRSAVYFYRKAKDDF